jgi:hypothetical protein
LNPKWIKGFTIDYHFEAHQYLRMSVYDVDNETASLQDDDFLGYFVCFCVILCHICLLWMRSYGFISFVDAGLSVERRCDFPWMHSHWKPQTPWQKGQGSNHHPM